MTKDQEKIQKLLDALADINDVAVELLLDAEERGKPVSDKDYRKTLNDISHTALTAMEAVSWKKSIFPDGVLELFIKTMALSPVFPNDKKDCLSRFEQAYLSGKMSAEDFRAVTEYNVYFFGVIAKSMGATIGECMKKVRLEGGISTGTISQALFNARNTIEGKYNAMIRFVYRT